MTVDCSVDGSSQWSLTFEVRKRYMYCHASKVLVSSQWSLTFEVRKRNMAPIIDFAASPSQWSLTFEVRKRARDFFGL